MISTYSYQSDRALKWVFVVVVAAAGSHPWRTLGDSPRKCKSLPESIREDQNVVTIRASMVGRPFRCGLRTWKP